MKKILLCFFVGLLVSNSYSQDDNLPHHGQIEESEGAACNAISNTGRNLIIDKTQELDKKDGDVRSKDV